MTTHETAVADLLTAVPEFVPEEWHDLDLPYVVYGGFARFIQDLYKRAPRNVELLERCLDFLESLAATDDDLANLVEVGVLEVLGDLDRGRGRRPAMTELLGLMGPKTAYLFRHVEALWDGTLDEFEKLPPELGLREQWPPLERS
jgi:hypothetical protein